jgi:hypothetical protein
VGGIPNLPGPSALLRLIKLFTTNPGLSSRQEKTFHEVTPYRIDNK